MSEPRYIVVSGRNTGVAYLCWCFCGVHYLYLGKPITQILFWITGGGLFIWALIDLFRIPDLVDQANAAELNRVHGAKKEPAKPGETLIPIIAAIVFFLVICTFLQRNPHLFDALLRR